MNKEDKVEHTCFVGRQGHVWIVWFVQESNLSPGCLPAADGTSLDIEVELYFTLTQVLNRIEHRSLMERYLGGEELTRVYLDLMPTRHVVAVDGQAYPYTMTPDREGSYTVSAPGVLPFHARSIPEAEDRLSSVHGLDGQKYQTMTHNTETSQIRAEWVNCPHCGLPVERLASGVVVDVHVSGEYGRDQLDLDVEHEHKEDTK